MQQRDIKIITEFGCEGLHEQARAKVGWCD